MGTSTPTAPRLRALYETTLRGQLKDTLELVNIM